MQNNKYTLKVLHSQLTIKLSFFFECPIARGTICSSSETSKKIISIKTLQYTIKSSCAKLIRIYEAGGTGCLMEQMKTKNFIQWNYQLSPIIFMKLYVIHKSCQRRYRQFLV